MGDSLGEIKNNQYLEKENLNNQFVQIRLWDDCVNKCDFCSLRNRCRTTPIKAKKERIAKTSKLINDQKLSQIGLLGGEFFEGQLKGCEKEWLDLLSVLLKTGAQIYITANLIHKQYFLEETLKKLNGRVLICTSYDEVGRFHTDSAKTNWLNNINELHDQGVNIFCTCIPTQEFLDADFILPEWLGINLCDPHLGVDWYITVDKSHYHEHLLVENTLFNLPSRKTAIKWMRKHPQITRQYASYEQTHSDTIFAFDQQNCLYKEFNNRIMSGEYSNPKCGHPFFCQCYSDSEKCMMCDAKRVLTSIDYEVL